MLLLVAIVALTAVSRRGDEDRASGMAVTWGGTEGQPSCVYHREDNTVRATLTVDGEAPRPRTLTVTVTAYADENTSQPVGSSTRKVQVEGRVHRSLVVTIDVAQPPLVDVDGETACRLDTTD